MERQIVLTVDPQNKVVRVEKIDDTGKRVPACQVEPGELADVPLKHVGVILHRRKNPDCFYFDYLGSIWEVCF
jgi:hypothetical protein